MRMLLSLLALGVLALGMTYRVRFRRHYGAGPRGLTDEMIRQIEQGGTVEWDADEPLDLPRIRAEEERFWRETAWDEPDRS